MMLSVWENARLLPVQAHYDVVVSGGGPAGIAAAVTAARQGGRVCLIEHQGFLGGVWTAGLLSLILDARNKTGLITEIRRRLRERDAILTEHDLYDAEEMKRLLEEMCAEAGVDIRIYARVVAAKVENGLISHVIVEGKEGRFAIRAGVFVDATGDGDLAVQAGCGFDYGRPSDGLAQPMTLMALLTGVPEAVRASFCGHSPSCLSKDEFYQMLKEMGVPPSYTKPSLFPLPNGLCALMINHEYEKSGLQSQGLGEASISARQEIRRVVDAIRRLPGNWTNVRLVATAPYIGVREGRRIHGLYSVCLEDMLNGKRHEDGITHVHFAIDVHSIRKSDGGGYGAGPITEPTRPYDIPLRALIAADVNNLALAGRCISGDFYAHASYRVTGNAVATGEAAGILAALAVGQGRVALSDVPSACVLTELEKLRRESAPALDAASSGFSGACR